MDIWYLTILLKRTTGLVTILIRSKKSGRLTGAVSKVNDVLVCENQCMSDCEPPKFPRNSRILDQYGIKDRVIQNTNIVEFPNPYNAANVSAKSRGDSVFYLRTINTLLEEEICENKWGNAETYDHTRRPNNGGNYNGNGRNASKGTFARQNNNMSKRPIIATK